MPEKEKGEEKEKAVSLESPETQEMVAISLYRGNLHKVSDVPRRWLMPSPKLSIKDFKLLLKRRSKALSRLCSSPNPDPNSTSNPNHQIDPPKDRVLLSEIKSEQESVGGQGQKREEGGDCPVNILIDGSDSFVRSKPDGLPGESNLALAGEDSTPKPADAETSNKWDVMNDKEKRKREVEEKLQVLNAKKHNLVQVLKQILNAEEELKRRNTMQGIAMRPCVPMQVDGTTESGSIPKQMASRIGLDTNIGGDMEVGEADDLSNPNIHPRHVLRTSSMSPSSESPLRRPPNFQQSTVSHPSRASIGVSGSPSRFAPAGHQGTPSNPLSVSVSGTNYVASSPSPATSGGTSVFRDARQPSPWN